MYHLKLHQIVRLREALQKWRKLAHKRKSFSSSSSRRGATSSIRVPSGHLAVYVGQERERFVIKTSLLSHPLFKALLRKTEEEVGFHYEGGLTIPCEVSAFERLLHLMQGKHVAHSMPMLMMRVFHGHEHFDLSREDHPYGFQQLLRELLHLHIKEISSHLPARCLPESRLPLIEGSVLSQPIFG
ncbi:hypothetical protein GOP47_0004677 [Adiantum capillus-veneris]|uniref:Uncharacterized protein n=1 Tax=Adiantum capillus-veneris TaxID=13818 RepID=A0A9D4V803_ADICA|nr:hypothetical protein GOP47_0004677 [Adiantum capillus-veneris]